jgi:hypothetical protein
MQKVQLGNSHLNVTKVCLGTMTWGEQNTEAEAHSQLDYAVERGINFIDTAEMYPVMPRAETQGLTERYIGSWLKKSGQRDKVVIATKAAGPNAGITWVRGGARDFDAANLKAAVETSCSACKSSISIYTNCTGRAATRPSSATTCSIPSRNGRASPSKKRWPRWAIWSRKARSARSACPTNPTGA